MNLEMEREQAESDMSHPDIYLRKSVKTVNHSRFILFILDSY